RYGIHPDSLQNQIRSLPKPDLIWLTSVMTHWYPGVQQTIAEIRSLLPEAPIWLGGIYVRLCPLHARQHSGADRIVTAPLAELPTMVKAATGFQLQNPDQWQRYQAHPIPALDVIPSFQYAPILTSLGCPYRCPYCASRTLAPEREQRSAASIYREIAHWHQNYGIMDFAFYDDALLLNAEATLRPVLERFRHERLGVRFHTPNALHIRALTPEWCALLKEGGFTTLRLGLETTQSDHQREWGSKVETTMFLNAMANLKAAGFDSTQIGVYLLCGLPGQSPAEVEESIGVVREAGAQAHLAEYSPLPGTPMWYQAQATCRYDIAGEPLYHNNSFFACRRPDFTYEDLLRLKAVARQARL
ncbi:MAG TPA: B12-binding domain-containing radical SAM protein, partial [Syntrophobacteraceae bacterium]|nr:B12-binding domain-containing radical SAM protein [Syntrophobacteraceae bacterium]